MIGLIDWAAARARMVLAFVALSVIAGLAAYLGLPKEGEPDIEIPALFISVPFPGISALDAEKLLVKPMETELADLDGLKTMSGTAQENYGGLMLEFEFGWDKTKILADVRDAMNTAEADFPDGAQKYSINEINFSEFPVVVVALSGNAPERTLLRLSKELQDKVEALEPVLEVSLAGHRDEMVEVEIDPLRLEAYNVTAAELISVVRNNNQLIAADAVQNTRGTFSVTIPSSFNSVQDIYALPVKTNGDRVVTLGDLATIRLTYADRKGTARFNGQTTVALQVVKRKGFNIIDTVALVRETVAATQATWAPELQQSVSVTVALDQSRTVGSMVSQLEGSVLTAIALVMIVVLATLGTRSALLVGFAIPTSFLLTFLLLGLMGVAISNIVMFGLILAVGILVDGAIVVVEYADTRIAEGQGPMRAYVEAAKRMFWPVISSTATTLCAFLPMLFWPGVAGEFMGLLPVTIIFVLSASLLVALIYLPIVGGVAGKISRMVETLARLLHPVPMWGRLLLALAAIAGVFTGALLTLNPALFAGARLPSAQSASDFAAALPGAALFIASSLLASTAFESLRPQLSTKHRLSPQAPHPGGVHGKRTPFGRLIEIIVSNPVAPVFTIMAVIGFIIATFTYYGKHNNGISYFVESEVEQAVIYLRARGNLSLNEKDAVLAEAEAKIIGMEGISSIFAFAGEGGLNQNTGGAQAPRDTVAQIQVETTPWEDRPDRPDLKGAVVMERVMARLAEIPGVKAEFLAQDRGPASGKPIHLRLIGDDFTALNLAVARVEAQLDTMAGVEGIEDTRPLPGIDWQIDVDVTRAGRFGADVATVGGMVQLVTQGILLDTMRVDSSDEEIDIRVRLPAKDRTLATLDTLKVRTSAGLVPLANFITRKPVPKLGRIDRVDQNRTFDVKAGIVDGMARVMEGDVEVALIPQADLDAIATGDTGVFDRFPPEFQTKFEDGTYAVMPFAAQARMDALAGWLAGPDALPAGVRWEWAGDMVEQQESQAFLGQAFSAALALMFIILLAQFNSFYNAALVLIAVVMSTAGVLIGMLVMGQPFSTIMTGVGIVALAGIVVNNNIILIDTFQEYSRQMQPLEAVIRTCETRIRPVALTTITTMAGLAPMMFGLSLDFFNGGYSIDSPTALWWKQLATAVVFGLGIATVLAMVFTPSMLALRIWIERGAYAGLALAARKVTGRDPRAKSAALAAQIAAQGGAIGTMAEIVWDDMPPNADAPKPASTTP